MILTNLSESAKEAECKKYQLSELEISTPHKELGVNYFRQTKQMFLPILC